MTKENDEFGTSGLRGLLELFNLSNKKDVEKYVRDLVITKKDLNTIIMACASGRLESYIYNNLHIDITPEHLHPTEIEYEALANNGVGKLQGKAINAVRKMFQIFKDRKLLSVHFFYIPDHSIWHLIYFDQRDMDETKNNHWKDGGSHVHYSRESFTNVPLQTIWDNLHVDKPKLPKSIHIKYID